MGMLLFPHGCCQGLPSALPSPGGPAVSAPSTCWRSRSGSPMIFCSSDHVRSFHGCCQGLLPTDPIRLGGPASFRRGDSTAAATTDRIDASTI